MVEVTVPQQPNDDDSSLLEAFREVAASEQRLLTDLESVLAPLRAASHAEDEVDTEVIWTRVERRLSETDRIS